MKTWIGSILILIGTLAMSYGVAAPQQDERPAVAMEDARLAQPAWEIHEGETFTGQVDIRTSRVAYIDCEFDGTGALYCVKIWPGARGTQFVDCTFTGADKKAIVGEWFAARRCTFEDIGEDGVFVTQGGHVSLIACKFRRLGSAPGGHSDAVQIAMGASVVIRNCYFQVPHLGGVDGPLSNSCIFVEYDPQFGAAVEDITIGPGNVFDGGLYSVWVRGNVRSERGSLVEYFPKRVLIYGNLFARHYFGPHNIDARADVLEVENDYSQAEKYRPSVMPPQEEIEKVYRRAG